MEIVSGRPDTRWLRRTPVGPKDSEVQGSDKSVSPVQRESVTYAADAPDG